MLLTEVRYHDKSYDTNAKLDMRFSVGEEKPNQTWKLNLPRQPQLGYHWQKNTPVPNSCQSVHHLVYLKRQYLVDHFLKLLHHCGSSSSSSISMWKKNRNILTFTATAKLASTSLYNIPPCWLLGDGLLPPRCLHFPHHCYFFLLPEFFSSTTMSSVVNFYYLR